MPLLDHFHPPVEHRCAWETFHSAWATHIANRFNDRWLSEEYVAHEHTGAKTALEIDIATFERSPDESASPPTNGASAVAVTAPAWSPSAARGAFPAVFPPAFEVRVFQTPGGRKLVGAIELLSPGNKDRPAEHRAFAAKCGSYLQAGVSVVVLDIVTNRRANLHNETVRLLELTEEWLLPGEWELYAVAYRPVVRDGRQEIDVWTERCELGRPLPTMPLRLTGDLFVPVEFEMTYQETCFRHRVSG